MDTFQYDIVKVLGNGSFGKVYRAINRKTKEDFVIKEINLEDKAEKPREVTILETLSHESIVKLHKYEAKDNKLKIFQEFCYFGHVGEYVQRRNKVFSEEELWSIYYSLLSALNHCHSLKIVHLDLKNENIFVDSKERFKLGDFGLSVQLNEAESIQNRRQGTLRYQAPEIFNEDSIDLKVDIWALGCVFYFLAAGELPFQGKDPEEQRKLVNEVLPTQIPRRYSRALNKFVNAMLHKRREKRPDSSKLLSLIPEQYKLQYKNLNKSLDAIIINELNESTLAQPETTRESAQRKSPVRTGRFKSTKTSSKATLRLLNRISKNQNIRFLTTKKFLDCIN